MLESKRHVREEEVFPREGSEKDYRVVAVALTAKGREMVANVPQIAQGLFLKGRKGLSDPEHLLSPEVNVPGRKINGPENRTGEDV